MTPFQLRPMFRDRVVKGSAKQVYIVEGHRYRHGRWVAGVTARLCDLHGAALGPETFVKSQATAQRWAERILATK